MDETRAILHVDMDAFFASIAQRDDPSLRGKPVLVGGTSKRGVVAAASYEAREFGCHSAMPTAVALRLCPHAICVKVPGARIREDSERMFEVLHDFTDQVEPLSVDEAFLDVTGSQRLLGDAQTIAREIRRRIAEELKLTASIGVAFNKFLAKLASDLDKPDGLTVVTPQNVDAVLAPLSVGRLWGVGPVTQQKLEAMGIHTFADLRRQAPATLKRRFGVYGERLHHLAFGRDLRGVTPDRTAKSIGQEQTFAENLTDPDVVREVLLRHLEHVAYRVRRAGFEARGVSIKVRFGDFQTISRSAMLPEPTDQTRKLWEAVVGLYDEWASRQFQPVRLIGCTAERLSQDGSQLALFGGEESDRQHRLDDTLDRINEKFGKRSVHRGSPGVPDREVWEMPTRRDDLDTSG